jgi:hypothetical protein
VGWWGHSANGTEKLRLKEVVITFRMMERAPASAGTERDRPGVNVTGFGGSVRDFHPAPKADVHGAPSGLRFRRRRLCCSTCSYRGSSVGSGGLTYFAWFRSSRFTAASK